MRMAVEVSDELSAAGRSLSVIAFNQIKPINSKAISEILGKFDRVVVLEEAVPTGGLFDDFVRAKNQMSSNSKIQQLSLKDEFIHCYGTHDQLLEKHGITKAKLKKLLD